jgi:hypothetical protein
LSLGFFEGLDLPQTDPQLELRRGHPFEQFPEGLPELPAKSHRNAKFREPL